ncbi:hypothetical protein HN51_036722, partial [Arachis hypogaea]
EEIRGLDKKTLMPQKTPPPSPCPCYLKGENKGEDDPTEVNLHQVLVNFDN